jgi:hypothetical protein
VPEADRRRAEHQIRGANFQHLREQLPEFAGLTRFGDEVDRAQGARMARMGFVVLPRKHDYLDLRRVSQQFADQAKPLVGAVRGGWQPEIHQRELGRAFELLQQASRPRPRFRRVDDKSRLSTKLRYR